MPIGKTQYGTHADVLFLEFGHGDIMFTRGAEEGAKFDSSLIFSQSEVHEIGAETDDLKGLFSDAIPNVSMVFKFTKPESITALIHSLVELQKDLFRAQAELITS